MKSEEFDVLIVGAGAAGMMCAIEAGKRGRRVLVVDHAAAPGEKIRISGGGRCNFTNIGAGPANYLSANPHFAKSALVFFFVCLSFGGNWARTLEILKIIRFKN